jgi:hypothetical protein
VNLWPRAATRLMPILLPFDSDKALVITPVPAYRSSSADFEG